MKDEADEDGFDGKFEAKQVKVEYLNLGWLFAGRKNFTALAPILAAMPTRFYNTRFSVTICDYFWDEVKDLMFWRQFVPYTLLVIFTVFYFHGTLTPEAQEL